jgi:hypothetical protein
MILSKEDMILVVYYEMWSHGECEGVRILETSILPGEIAIRIEAKDTDTKDHIIKKYVDQKYPKANAYWDIMDITELQYEQRYVLVRKAEDVS